MPSASAVSMMLRSARAATDFPFSVNVTSLASSAVLVWCIRDSSFPLLDFLGEILQHGQLRIGRGLAETADRGVHHRLRQLLQQRLVPVLLAHQAERFLGAHAAGGALAARFVLEEPHHV